MYINGTSNKVLIWSRIHKKNLEFYINTNLVGGWNQEEGMDPGFVLSVAGYVITYANCLIIWVSRLQIEIAISTPEAEYIALSQAIRYVLPFAGLM